MTTESPLNNQEPGIIQEDYDWVRPYIQCITDFCTLTDSATGKQIPITFPPERAYADQTSRVKIGGVETKRETIPLPYMSLSLLDILPDNARYQDAGYRTLQYSNDNKQVYGVKWPEPYNFMFQLDIRVKYNTDWFRIMRAFHDGRIRHGAATIAIPIGCFGRQNHYVFIEGPNDNSDIEPGDNRDRVIRKTYTITVEGWLLETPKRTPTMLYTQIDTIDSVTDETIESYTVDGHKFDELTII